MLLKESFSFVVGEEFHTKGMNLENIQTQIKEVISSPDSKLRAVGTIIGAVMVVDACIRTGNITESLAGGALYALSQIEKLAELLNS